MATLINHFLKFTVFFIFFWFLRKLYINLVSYFQDLSIRIENVINYKLQKCIGFYI
jgi:hypothetical protein